MGSYLEMGAPNGFSDTRRAHFWVFNHRVENNQHAINMGIGRHLIMRL